MCAGVLQCCQLCWSEAKTSELIRDYLGTHAGKVHMCVFFARTFEIRIVTFFACLKSGCCR
jgi:hypothetical protein